ncbi:hypothetical protein DT075_04920 [Bacillus licheniformis]|nr:hypothetical protein DT075_04920 [Bacillus licheniformis]
MNTAAALSNDFRSIFKTEKTPRTFFAPGRINLIGIPRLFCNIFYRRHDCKTSI